LETTQTLLKGLLPPSTSVSILNISLLYGLDGINGDEGLRDLITAAGIPFLNPEEPQVRSLRIDLKEARQLREIYQLLSDCLDASLRKAFQSHFKTEYERLSTSHEQY
jgi:hypothetical protein